MSRASAMSLTGTCDAFGATPAYPYDGGMQFFCAFHTQRMAQVDGAKAHLDSLLYNTLSVFAAAYEGTPVLAQLAGTVGIAAEDIVNELLREAGSLEGVRPADHLNAAD